jgi:hemoglobin/transferrin/lactoferrin receptor protein
VASTHPSSRFALRELSWLIGLACGTALTAHAQPVAPSPVLKEVVISGSRSEQDPDELPMSIDVIHARDIEARQIQDIRDVAADLPNVTVPRSPARFTIGAQTGRDQNTGFNIRGLEGNRVLMLVDGIRQPRSYVFPSESAIGRDYVDMGIIKRVEIVRGATSALYGSDGVGGLVNFITKDPSDYLGGDRTFGGSASVGYSGDDGGVRTGVTLAGRANDAFAWLISAGVSQSDALKNKGQNDAANTDRTTPNPETDKDQTLLAKLVFTPGGGQKHVLTFEHSDKKADYNLLSNVTKPPLVGTSTLGSRATTNMQRDRLSYDGRWQLDAAVADELRAVLSYQDTRTSENFMLDRLTAIDRVRNTDYSERSLQASLQANKLVRMGGDAAQKITYGVDYASAEIRNLQTGIDPPAGEAYPVKRFPDTQESSLAVFAQDEIIMGRWSVTPGVRVDHFNIKASQAGFGPAVTSLSGSAVSPKLGALFRATPEWSVYGNYASGFKAPNAGQVNSFFANPLRNYQSVANPNLKPEKSQNFELGARGRLSHVTLDVAAFTGNYKDFIEDFVQVSGVGTAANPLIYQSVNRSEVRISGFEVKGSVDMGRVGAGSLSLPFSYGETRGTNKSTGRPLDSIQPAKLSLGAAYDTGAWSTRLNVTRYAAKKFEDIGTPYINGVATQPQFAVPAATTVDLSGQWRINKGLRLNAGIYNLTDRKYWQWASVLGQSASSATLDAYTQPGRYVRVSMVADF